MVEVKLLKKLREGASLDKDDSNQDLEGSDRIVDYLDSFKFRQHVIIVFECLGLNLYRYMKANRSKSVVFEPPFLVHIVRQICQGLKFMKSQGVIHCDMKPENVIFVEEECLNVKLIDFGASCLDYKTGFSYV
jgi:dual specificity tyrosine-phosphorylation-regulated kinase 2/3/4